MKLEVEVLDLMDRPKEALLLRPPPKPGDPRELELLAEYAIRLARAGRVEEARRMDSDIAARIWSPNPHKNVWHQRARIAAALGDKERALFLLKTAFGYGIWTRIELEVDIALESIRDDPAFKAMVKPED